MSILNQIESDNSLTPLLGDYDQNFVGYVYSMGFSEAKLLTNDYWKERAMGIPHNSFLVAASFDPERFSSSPTFDREVILLRVIGPDTLPTEMEILKAKIEFNQQRTREERFASTSEERLDPITQNEFQFSALKCRVLGTFYEDENEELRLGSDLENYMSSSRLRVFKPRGTALGLIVNHINPEVKKRALEEARKVGFHKEPSPIEIGTIRYTSTSRLHRSKEEPKVHVKIQPSDFLARRTAILGMTRTGKSNTVKTTVASVALAAMRDGVAVGQIIFDINGEYANANHQDDGSSIAEVFGEHCIRYRSVETPGFEDLRFNFYKETDQALNLIQSLFKEEKSPYANQQDMKTFMDASLEEPEREARSEHNRWRRLRSVFQAILHQAGYKSAKGFKIYVPLGKSLLEQLEKEEVERIFEQDYERLISIRGGIEVTPDMAIEWFRYLRKKNLESPLHSSSGKGRNWVDPTLEAFLNVLERKNSSDQLIGGYRALVNYRAYHSPVRVTDVIDEIMSHLQEGKIVILDLSVGPVEVRTVLSERIASRIFHHSFDIMNSGDVPGNIVIYIEEAHNLIGKKHELTDTWPRIAKEGAKAKIALVYATQEPSSIHPNILANTENWFVTHLNNVDELKTLGKFYDFSDFMESLLHAQDVGFARIKTLSSPFVVPTQINRFTPSEIKEEIRQIKGSLF